MDKNAIKKYAVWARRELISRVSQKAMQYGITESEIVPANAASVNGKVLSAEEISQRRALIEQIKVKGYEQVMEEVAYTWFNRFIALRFMEVNGYLPSRVRVFTDENNAFKPQILAEAINLELDGLDMDKVYALKEANDNEALFKYLIIVQCNALSPILPGMFQEISDCTELLFPDNLLRDGSVVEQMISMIPEEDWTDQVQIIGWLYQYYNTEKKDEVFAALKKNVKITKENIPAATQLFTPDWIVRYMVENSLGRLWVEGHPNDELKSEWKYYLEEAAQEPEVQAQLAEIRKEYAALTPEQIKCIDPCAGSGHILAYMFDVLMQIYEAYGYTAREAVRSIVENNIYGLDIDDRAAQLAYFAVMMKARQYDRRFFTRKAEDGNPDVPQPHVYAIVESNGIDAHALEYFVNGDPKLKEAMDSIIREMRDAKEYGSILNITPVDFDALYTRFEEVADDISLSKEAVLYELLPLVRAAEALALKYDVVVTNPPYMGGSSMSGKLSDFVKKHYPDSKSDLFACCIEKGNRMVVKNGFNCMVTMQSWMFLSSFEKMRETILHTKTITNLMHMENMVMGIAFGTAVTVFRNCATKEYKGTYNHITLKDIEDGHPKEFPVSGNRFAQVSTDNFSKIPGSPVAYWVSEAGFEAFEAPDFSKRFMSGGRNKTHNNELYVRTWWEVVSRDSKWQPYSNGGEYRKWYGNNIDVVDWSPKARESYASHGGLIVEKYWDIPAITWNDITSGKASFRIKPQHSKYSSVSPTLISSDGKYDYTMLAFLNCAVSEWLNDITNPTLHTLVGNVLAFPDKIQDIDTTVLSTECVELSKSDWDSFETSWDFLVHPLILAAKVPDMNGGHKATLADLYLKWETLCDNRFAQLKSNEEELNRIFIDIYGLQDELIPEVEDKDVTVRKADLKRDIKSLISYAVGCMFGRYSLDVEGLAYAGGEWDDSKYTTFKADRDNVIPICDSEYFEDDIVGRFVRFIELVYGKETLDENLKFIADALGGSGQPKDVIRKYFMDEFYTDHLKIYQKRPIYWLFDSGKKGGFRALIYMHRYQPDTIARIRTDYVHEQQSRYHTAIVDLEQRIATASTSERVKLNKQLKKLKEQSEEIHKYEEKIHHLADQYIAIDLDDGVKVNYAKFQDVLAKIK